MKFKGLLKLLVISFVVVGIFSVIGTLLDIYAMPLLKEIPTAGLTAALTAMFATLGFLTNLFQFAGASVKDFVDIGRDFKTRESYLDAMIDNSSKAKELIFLSVHTLNPSHSNKRINRLQESLQKAHTDKKMDVRVLTPGGIERTEALYELAIQRSLPIRIASSLQDEDFRYSLFDKETTLVSLKSTSLELESVGAEVKSEKLSKLLRNYFDSLWSHESTARYPAYIANVIRGLLDPSLSISNSKIAQMLNIPDQEVNYWREAKFIFVLGRPGAGKTKAVQLATQRLTKEGFTESRIAILDDYELLWDRFLKDRNHQRFTPGLEGGFAVLDFSVLHEVLVQTNKKLDELRQSHDFVFIEFSRPDYIRAMENFSETNLARSTIFYLNVPLEICIKRNEQRRSLTTGRGKGYVPEQIITEFYKQDDILEVFNFFQDHFHNIGNSDDELKEAELAVEKAVGTILYDLKSRFKSIF